MYTGPFATAKVPALAVISLYLILGIGVDAIFVIANTYALSHLETPCDGTLEVEMHPVGPSEAASSSQALGEEASAPRVASISHGSPVDLAPISHGAAVSPPEKIEASVAPPALATAESRSSSVVADERDNRPLVSSTRSASPDDHAHDGCELCQDIHRPALVREIVLQTFSCEPQRLHAEPPRWKFR